MFTIKLGFYRKQMFFAHPNARRENFETQRIFFLSNPSWEDHVHGILTFSCFKTVLCLVIFCLITNSGLLGKNLKIAFFQNGFVKFF